MAKIKGIDISAWQETVDFTKVKADGIKFCIFREGFRQTIDKRFLEYVKGATKAGIPILGVYHFSYALTEADARKEATTCINNLKKAGLGKDVIVFYDFEYDTVKQAKDKGVSLGKKQCIAFTKAFCEQVTKLGYKAGIYSNIDYYKNMYDKDLLSKYVFWLAHYTSGDPAYKCTFQQYTSSGKVKGINGNVDMNWFYGNVEEKKVKYLRSKVVKIMQDWVGKKESDGSHKVIIDTYNKISPLPVGYKLKYTDAWCAGTVSAAFHKAGYDAIFPSECGCGRMVTLAKKMGIWVENDAYKPSPGDCVLYDWQDTGKGDNTGEPDHVGMVEKINGNTITVIEGNYSNAVTRRALLVNGRYIRGFICPKFDAEATKTTTTDKKSSTTTQKTTTKASTPSYKVGKNYTVSVDCLNVRTGAGTNYTKKTKKQLTIDGQKHSNSNGQLMKGTEVTCMQTKTVSGSVWMKIPSGWICAYYAPEKAKYVK